MVGRSRFLNSVNDLLLFVIISPWKRTGPFIWTNLNPFHLRMLCAKFGWNWPGDSGEEDFLKVISLFCNFLPLEKGEAYWPNDVLCHVWLKLVPVVLEKKIFKFCQYIFTLLLSSLGRSFGQTRISFTQVWLKLVPWF